MTKREVTDRYLMVVDTLMRQNGWNQSDFCYYMGYKDTIVSRFRMKGWDVSTQKLIELKTAFPSVNIGYCFGETTKMMQEPTPVNGKSYKSGKYARR